MADQKRLGGEPRKKKEQHWVLAHGVRQQHLAACDRVTWRTRVAGPNTHLRLWSKLIDQQFKRAIYKRMSNKITVTINDIK